MPRPVDFECLAQLTVDTFRQIYRVSRPGMLRYKCFDSVGISIRCPMLGLTPKT